MGFDSIPFNPALRDENLGYQTLTLAIFYSVLIILSTGTRLCYRLWHFKTLSFDDFFIFSGLAFNLTANILEVVSCHAGYGRHLQFLTVEQRRTTRMLTLYIIFLSNIALWSIKMSISLFLLKLITGVHRRVRWIVYTLMFFTSAATSLEFIVWLLQAKPLPKAWNPDIPGTVSNPEILLIAHVISQVIGSIVDLFYALSPIYFFTPLQINVKKKTLLLSLTGFGLIVFAFAISHLTVVNAFYNPDFTWALRIVFILALNERNLAEVIANLPALAPLFKVIHRRIIDSIMSSRYEAPSSNAPSFPLASLVTFGSPRKKSSLAIAGTFRAYGKGVQITDITTTGYPEDELTLTSHSIHQRPSSSAISLSR
ncbi:integral membrane protein [Xylaria sp. FL0064]|nr:integral membrane protein [Xylaria sp. FL0064]